jgi:hypothetical protein
MYEKKPILSKISNGSQYLAAIFGKLPSEFFLSFTFKKTWSPTLNSLCVFPFSSNLFLRVLCNLQIQFYFHHMFFHSLSNSGQMMDLSFGLSKLICVLHLLLYNASNVLIFKDA